MVGQTILNYRILEKPGEGGMGVVYGTRDLTLDQMVAVGFPPIHLSRSEVDRARSIVEARAASALTRGLQAGSQSSVLSQAYPSVSSSVS